MIELPLRRCGVRVAARDLGKVSLRSIAEPLLLYAIELAPAFDAAWIDPVCKMHAPYAAYRRSANWFYSERCAEAYRRSPDAYHRGTQPPIAPHVIGALVGRPPRR